jgi:hypothetical protein
MCACGPTVPRAEHVRRPRLPRLIEVRCSRRLTSAVSRQESLKPATFFKPQAAVRSYPPNCSNLLNLSMEGTFVSMNMKPTNGNFDHLSRKRIGPCVHAQSLAEQELLTRARGGDQAAFGELCRRPEPRLLRTARHILRNEEDARDAVQEVLLSGFINLSKFDGRSSFFTWVTRIAINSSLMQLRKRRQFFLRLADDYPEDLALKDPAPKSGGVARGERRTKSPQRGNSILVAKAQSCCRTKTDSGIVP